MPKKRYFGIQKQSKPKSCQNQFSKLIENNRRGNKKAVKRCKT